MKGALARQEFIGPSHFLDGISAFLDESQKSGLEHVFHHWIECGRWMLDRDGDPFMDKHFVITIPPSSASITRRPLLAPPIYQRDCGIMEPGNLGANRHIARVRFKDGVTERDTQPIAHDEEL
jgi:hypothetical protein